MSVLPAIGTRVVHNMSRAFGVVVGHVDATTITVKRDDGVTYDTYHYNWHVCQHRRHNAFILKSGSPSSGARTCSDCGDKFFWCAFCDETGPAVRGTGWTYFAHVRRCEPPTFPVDPAWYREGREEQREWLCCTACIAESGLEAMTRYMNSRYAMHPEPSYTRVFRFHGFKQVTIEERTR